MVIKKLCKITIFLPAMQTRKATELFFKRIFANFESDFTNSTNTRHNDSKSGSIHHK